MTNASAVAKRCRVLFAERVTYPKEQLAADVGDAVNVGPWVCKG